MTRGGWPPLNEAWCPGCGTSDGFHVPGLCDSPEMVAVTARYREVMRQSYALGDAMREAEGRTAARLRKQSQALRVELIAVYDARDRLVRAHR